MSEPYKFEFGGATIEYNRPTVKTGIDAGFLRRKLIRAYQYQETVPSDEYERIDEYAAAMSRITKIDAPWWGHGNMSDDDLKQAFECFLEQDEDLLTHLKSAHYTIITPKKTP